MGATLITFVPQAADGTAASALTNEDGSFEMQAFPPDSGAVAGKYTAVVVKTVVAEPVESLDSHDTPPPKPKAGPNDVPAKYGKPETSTLLVVVPEEGRTDLKIEIKD